MRVAAASCISFLSFVLLSSLAGAIEPLVSNQDVIRFQWESRDSSFLDSQRSFLNYQGGQVGHIKEKIPETKNPAAIALLVVTGVAAVSSLAEAVVRSIKDYQHGGVVIDMQGPDVKIIENKSLPHGQVLIRKSDGEVISLEYKSGASPDLSAIMASLLKSAKTP